MPDELFDRHAPKAAIEFALNSDLVAKARNLGLDPQRLAEDALERAVVDRSREVLHEEIRKDLEILSAYLREHGSPVDMAREQYARFIGDDEAV